MHNAELKPSVWIPALIRRAQSAGAFATIIRKGDPDGGTALILVRQKDGLTTLYRPVRNMSGQRVWWPKGPLPEQDHNPYVFARVDEDPDVWIVEIEDRDGRHFLTEPIEEDV